MVTNDSLVFRAVADPTRRAILDLLRGGEQTVGDLASRFPVSRPAVSKHLRVLRQAGLVQERRVAQSRHYALNAQPLQEVEFWVQRYRLFWSARLQDLKRYVESPEGRRTRGSGRE